MRKNDHLGFNKQLNDIKKSIFIPKYYNPEIEDDLDRLSSRYDLILFKDLIKSKDIFISSGNEIGKMAYGTGNIPFIRTSDISNWEIKSDPKQGVNKEIYNEYSSNQDVKEGDILFVKDGTYLIGQSCIVTKYDLPCLYQSHIYKIRVNEESKINQYLLFATLNSKIVKRQIRSKQFTADIIDTIGNRITELMLPFPKDENKKIALIKSVQNNINLRAELKDKLKRSPFFAEGLINNIGDRVPSIVLSSDLIQSNSGFVINLMDIKKSIFIPKYYDPNIPDDIKKLKKTHDCVSLKELVKQDVISWKTGIEIGKMAYGTGNIPFIRTSDISNWEIKSDPKQLVSEDIYQENKQDVQAEDIFIVRDGTYLVGTSCIVSKYDTKILFCGGLYKLRVEKKKEIDPFLLITLLNTPIVKRQMRSKQFTRDIIDTLGKRIFEIIIPIPQGVLKNEISKITRDTIEKRIKLRNESSSFTFN